MACSMAVSQGLLIGENGSRSYGPVAWMISGGVSHSSLPADGLWCPPMLIGDGPG